MNTPVNFELAKLLKEKGYDLSTEGFYPKPKCKLFGIDEHGRYYPIVNKTQSSFHGKPLVYFHGKAVVLKEENYYNAPTISEVVMWLYEKHGIWIESTMGKDHTGVWFDWDIFSTITPRKDDVFGEEGVEYEDSPNEKWLNYDTTYSSMIDEHFATMDKKSCSSPAEAYEAAIEYTLKNLL